MRQQFQHGLITAPGPKIIELSGLMPGAIPETVLADAIRAAGNGSLEQAVTEALQEVRKLASNDKCSDTDKEPIYTANRTGDFFWSKASTYGVAHGHNGIYVSPNETVQALDPTRGVQLVLANDYNHTICRPRLYTILPTNGYADVRDRAAAWARTRVGSGYNNDFAFNHRDWKTGETGTYNCSQIVWGAYMNGSGGSLDLDSDGGFGVYPDDLISGDKVWWYAGDGK